MNVCVPVRAGQCPVFDTFLIPLHETFGLCTHSPACPVPPLPVSLLSTSSLAFSTLLLLYQQYLSCMSMRFANVGAYQNKSNVARLGERMLKMKGQRGLNEV